MSLFLPPKTKQKRRQKALFFVILVILIVSIFYLLKYLITPKFSQSPPINYYFELNLSKYNQLSSSWLKNNPSHQKLFNLWQGFYQKYAPEPPPSLFPSKISLINVIYAPAAEIRESRLLQEGKDEVIILAYVSNTQNLTKYLKNLGQISPAQEEKIQILTPLVPISNYNVFYFSITKKNQFILASNRELLTLALKNKINLNFPKENIFFPLSQSSPNEFLKIYSKPEKLPVLSQFIQSRNSLFWLSFVLEPQKIMIDFKTNFEKSPELSHSWSDIIQKNQDLVVFSQDLSGIFNNPTLFPEQKNWQELYAFDLKNDLYPLLKNNQAGLILIPKDTKYTLNWSNYHLILAVSNKNWSQESPEIRKIEQIAKNVFAQKFLSEEKVVLPDKSTITELVARPENFEFQQKDFANIGLKYLQKPGSEFAYAFVADKIIFSTSINLLEQIINSQNTSQNPQNPLINCLNTENIPSDFVIFSPNSEFQAKYGLTQLILTNEKVCIY